MAEDDEPTSVTPMPTPPPDDLLGRPSLKRRITRPSFMIELVAGSRVGEYEIQEQIGEGAMGTVYSAVHPLIGKKVAIKILKPELCANQATINRFVHEAQAVNQIGHPNIVDVFSLDELPDGRAYMVMEWLRGEDLKARLARGPITVVDSCDILDGIARALEAAHAKQIVHRDLKPDNVFLHQVDNGPLMVKLLDFGIAKLVRLTPGTEKTQTGNMLGTPRYISPEQARGVQVDYRSDIYSLGVMAFEMLAGRPPFKGETAMDIVVQHLNEPPPALGQFAKVPKSLEQCVMAMLEKDPDLRPTLEDVRGILIDPTRRMTPIPTRAQPVTKRSARWPFLLLGLVGAAGVGWLSWKFVVDQTQKDETVAVSSNSVVPAPTLVESKEPPPPPVVAPSTGSDTATLGTLDVTVSGAKDAVIEVDGAEKTRGASLKIELDPGKHEITVKAPGRPPHTESVEISAGESNRLSIVVPAMSTASRPPPRTVKKEPKRERETKPEPKISKDDELLTPKRNR